MPEKLKKCCTENSGAKKIIYKILNKVPVFSWRLWYNLFHPTLFGHWTWLIKGLWHASVHGVLISGLANLFSRFAFGEKNLLPSTRRLPRKLLYQYSRAIWSIFFVFLCTHCRENSKSLKRSARSHILCCRYPCKRIKCCV